MVDKNLDYFPGADCESLETACSKPLVNQLAGYVDQVVIIYQQHAS